MADSSFDIVSEVDKQEADNALNQAAKEVAQRFDFKNTGTTIEWKGDLVLLHELATGAADRSYGLSVAKLAGVPAPVIKRAKAVLDKLEKGREQTGGLGAGLEGVGLLVEIAQIFAERRGRHLELALLLRQRRRRAGRR